MTRALIFAIAAVAAAAFAAVPAIVGLTANPSFSHQVPVRVPTQARPVQLVDAATSASREHSAVPSTPAPVRGTVVNPAEGEQSGASAHTGTPTEDNNPGPTAEPSDSAPAPQPTESEPGDPGSSSPVPAPTSHPAPSPEPSETEHEQQTGRPTGDALRGP
jgi:hypothetical protein